jgi:hypothetical protein
MDLRCKEACGSYHKKARMLFPAELEESSDEPGYKINGSIRNESFEE